MTLIEVKDNLSPFRIDSGGFLGLFVPCLYRGLSTLIVHSNQQKSLQYRWVVDVDFWVRVR